MRRDGGADAVRPSFLGLGGSLADRGSCPGEAEAGSAWLEAISYFLMRTHKLRPLLAVSFFRNKFTSQANES